MPSPLYETDKEIADRLASKDLENLTNDDITNASRILIRYSGVPNSEDIRDSIIMALHKWDKTPDQLNEKSKISEKNISQEESLEKKLVSTVN